MLKPLTSAHPPSPYVYNDPNSNTVLVFHDYGSEISLKDTYSVLLAASNNIILELRQHVDRPINPRGTRGFKLDYDADTVSLSVFPNEYCGWGTWGTVIQGLAEFLNRFEAVEVFFTVYENRAGVRERMGVGTLYHVPPAA